MSLKDAHIHVIFTQLKGGNFPSVQYVSLYLFSVDYFKATVVIIPIIID